MENTYTFYNQAVFIPEWKKVWQGKKTIKTYFVSLTQEKIYVSNIYINKMYILFLICKLSMDKKIFHLRSIFKSKPASVILNAEIC